MLKLAVYSRRCWMGIRSESWTQHNRVLFPSHWKRYNSVMEIKEAANYFIIKGHMAGACPNEQWCRFCKSPVQDAKMARADGERWMTWSKRLMLRKKKVDICVFQVSDGQPSGLRPDGRYRSDNTHNPGHWKNLDVAFQPKEHVLELADGTRGEPVEKERDGVWLHRWKGGGAFHPTHRTSSLWRLRRPKLDMGTMGTTGCTSWTVAVVADEYWDFETWCEILGHCYYQCLNQILPV